MGHGLSGAGHMSQFLFEYSIAQIPFICGEEEYVAAWKHEKPNSHVLLSGAQPILRAKKVAWS